MTAFRPASRFSALPAKIRIQESGDRSSVGRFCEPAPVGVHRISQSGMAAALPRIPVIVPPSGDSRLATVAKPLGLDYLPVDRPRSTKERGSAFMRSTPVKTGATLYGAAAHGVRRTAPVRY
jgi:hypothetical protein